MYESKIKTFYNHKQVMEAHIELSHSKSPLKPKLLLKYLKRHKIQEECLEIEHFKPFSQKNFLIAHTKDYVEAMYIGIKPLCKINWLLWSKELMTSLEYTNASLYAAMHYAIEIA